MSFFSLKKGVYQSVLPQVKMWNQREVIVSETTLALLRSASSCSAGVRCNEISSETRELRLLNNLGYSCLIVLKLQKISLVTLHSTDLCIARIRYILFKQLQEVQIGATKGQKSDFLFLCKMQSQIRCLTPTSVTLLSSY